MRALSATASWCLVLIIAAALANAAITAKNAKPSTAGSKGGRATSRNPKHEHGFTTAGSESPPSWRHDRIEGLRDVAYNEFPTLWRGRGDNGTMWYSFDRAAGVEPAVNVARLRSADGGEGWDYLRFDGLNTAADDEAYYAVGYAEGWLTFDEIFSSWNNAAQIFYDPLMLLPGGEEFVEAHLNYFNQYSRNTTFGVQVYNQRRLLEGMTRGWQDRYINLGAPANITTYLNFTQIYMISYMADVQDVLSKFASEAMASGWAVHASERFRALSMAALSGNQNGQHCSGFIKRTADDIFFAHDTWSTYNVMLRQFKTYRVGAGFVSFSSYPGSISSIDDWYMTSVKLAVMETTNGIYNASLYDLIIPYSLSEFNRVMAANFMATSPSEWFRLFATDNSGTFNNQYMVMDTAIAAAAAETNQPLPAGTFWVGEQIPGLVIAADQSELFNRQGYWASYNIPFYPVIYEASGFAAKDTPESAGMFSYTNYSRARIFRRMHHQVENITTMWYLMRYNQWQSDLDSEIPWCAQNGGDFNCSVARSSMLAIMSRGDLAPSDDADIGPAELAGTVNRALFGGIDTKLTSVRMLVDRDFEAVIVNGPTAVNQPHFNLTSFIEQNPSYAIVPWRGVPTFFDFDPIRIHPLN